MNENTEIDNACFELARVTITAAIKKKAASRGEAVRWNYNATPPPLPGPIVKANRR